MSTTQVQDEELDEKIQRLSENFKIVLSPMEPTIMRLQSLLVWENPAKSTVMMVGVHIIFWFFAYSGCRFYSTASSVLIVLYFLHTWRKKIWPEIRVPPKSPDLDDWTPVHPRLLSVPEVSKHLANSWCYVERCTYWWVNLRKTRPFRFCIEICFLCVCGAVVGSYISGVTLSYIIVMSLVLWPCLQYHNLLKKIYMKFEPIFMKLDYSIKVKNKWRYKGDGTSPIITTKEGNDNGKLTSSVCADNESDLEDFDPTDPVISAALARTITDSEDEGTSATLSPGFSKRYSDDDGVHEDEMEDDFALSIDAMPSVEALDNTDDELLSSDLALDESSMPSLVPTKRREMDFDPSHFNDNSSDEDTFQANYAFSNSAKVKPQGRVRKRQMPKRPGVEEYMKETFGAAMQAAIQSSIQSSVMGALQSMAGTSENEGAHGGGDRTANAYSDESADYVDHGRGQASRDRRASNGSASADIDEDFDFLDEYDLDMSREGDDEDQH